MKEQETTQEDYRLVRFWNNGFAYKFKGEIFTPQLLSISIVLPHLRAGGCIQPSVLYIPLNDGNLSPLLKQELTPFSPVSHIKLRMGNLR